MKTGDAWMLKEIFNKRR